VQDTTSWITCYYRDQNVWVSGVFKNYETDIHESDPNDIRAGMNSSGKHTLKCVLRTKFPISLKHNINGS